MKQKRNLYREAVIGLLAGLTTRKNEKEIWWNDENNKKITVECLNEDAYILRSKDFETNLILQYTIENNIVKDLFVYEDGKEWEESYESNWGKISKQIGI